jgi:hypothetical protein
MHVHGKERSVRAFLLISLAGLGLALVLALSSASPAQAIYKQFCWNKTLSGKPDYCEGFYDNGTVPYINVVGGSGINHSVCVWARFTGVTECSAGPNQGVYNETPDSTFGWEIEVEDPGLKPENWGFIENNAPGTNRVQAYYDYCNNPC